MNVRLLCAVIVILSMLSHARGNGYVMEDLTWTLTFAFCVCMCAVCVVCCAPQSLLHGSG